MEMGAFSRCIEILFSFLYSPLLFSFSLFISVELRVWEKLQPAGIFFSTLTTNSMDVLYKIYIPYNFIKL